jgi:guanylate kinase
MKPRMKPQIIGIVGPCAAGKTTLISGLTKFGYKGKQIAQEHSYVVDMWKRLTNPDVLIYLDVSYPLTLVRKKLTWSEQEYESQLRRLQHAKENADLYLNTDQLSPGEVLESVLAFLESISLELRL